MTTAEYADILRTAQADHTPCAALTGRDAGLSVDQAYAVQRHNIERRLEAGGRLIGRKIGLTSRAIQDQLGVGQPDFGCLLDDMCVADGAQIDHSTLLQPRAEAEVAFVLGRPLSGPHVTAADVIAACDFAVAAIEIIDSRIRDWDIDYADTIADNASSARFVLANKPVDLAGAGDLRLAGMTLRKNGRLVSTGAGAACLDHPINAVVWLVNKLAAFDDGLDAGQIVLSGALGPACDIGAGDWLSAQISGIGSVRVAFSDAD